MLLAFLLLLIGGRFGTFDRGELFQFSPRLSALQQETLCAR